MSSSTSQQARLNAIVEALASVADGVEVLEHEAGWAVGFGSSEVAVREADHWLCFDAPYCGPLERDWSLLEASGRLAAGVKLVRCGAEDAARVRAELPLVPGSDLIFQLRQIRRGFEQANGEKHRTPESGSPAGELAVVVEGGGGTPDPKEAEVRSSELAARCELAHLPFTPRSNGNGVVDLAAGAGFWQAEIGRLETGELWLRTLLAEPDSDACAGAEALFLLRTSGAMRLVRATAISGTSEHRGPGFEVRVGRSSAGAEIDDEAERLADAAGALAAACRFAGEEVNLIARSESLSRAWFESKRTKNEREAGEKNRAPTQHQHDLTTTHGTTHEATTQQTTHTEQEKEPCQQQASS